MTDPAVHITGLKEFRRGLKEIDAALPKALRVAHNRSAQIVVDDAVPKIPSRTGRARRSVRAASTQTKSRVKGGGKKTAYYPWLDFGGVLASGPERPFIKRGRYIYQSFYANRDRFTEVLEDSLVDVAEQAGIEVTRGQ
jgi:hypothetical protein